MAHIWQSVTCGVCFCVTHCSYSPLSIFAGGNSNGKLPQPHTYSLAPVTVSLSMHRKHSATRKTNDSRAANGLSSEVACSELPAAGVSQHFSPSFEETWRACPWCLHSWIHGKDCLIWNLTWALRLQGDMREGIQVGGREVAVRGSNTGQGVLKPKCAIDSWITSRFQGGGKKRNRTQLNGENKHTNSSSKCKKNTKPLGFLWSGGCSVCCPFISSTFITFVGILALMSVKFVFSQT